ncbi:hypothetical protein CDV36_003292 [Fusarium kuroshium]|uniref:Uncharacterized protein n=1 Tax=Fusarium kuroshium TaxID=2010991 RepID=A0A3M2SHK2_9HYPO|nr:hypothetical protein CDV36_003292 [Fusarium kuroshium]
MVTRMKAAITFSLKICPVPADRLVSQSLYGNAVIQTPPGDTWLTVADITTWSDYIVGVFKLRHPEIYGIDDVGAMLFGRVGREILAAGFVLYYTFVAGSMMSGISIGLNAISMHGTSTAIFVAVAAIVGGSFASIRTLGKMSWLALLAGKYLFVRFLRGTKHLTVNTFVHWGAWLGCVFGVTLTAYIIASAIPVFGGLTSFIGVLLGTLRSF